MTRTVKTQTPTPMETITIKGRNNNHGFTVNVRNNRTLAETHIQYGRIHAAAQEGRNARAWIVYYKTLVALNLTGRGNENVYLKPAYDIQSKLQQ